MAAPRLVPTSVPDLTARRLELAADGTVSVTEAMTFLSLGRTEVYAMMDRGEIAYRKAGRRRLVFRRSLVEWLAAGAVVEPK
ncbi:helix-turn-helix domain-containing protein [bacterium]|nr:helix-turn-helix domain-containing protein [bacterium]